MRVGYCCRCCRGLPSVAVPLGRSPWEAVPLRAPGADGRRQEPCSAAGPRRPSPPSCPTSSRRCGAGGAAAASSYMVAPEAAAAGFCEGRGRGRCGLWRRGRGSCQAAAELARWAAGSPPRSGAGPDGVPVRVAGSRRAQPRESGGERRAGSSCATVPLDSVLAPLSVGVFRGES